MTVGQLYEVMGFTEFMLWLKFFDIRPYGWREDLRAYKQMAATGNLKQGTTPGDHFPQLALMTKREAAANKAIPHSGSFAHKMLLSAKGGDKLPFLEAL